MFCRNYSKLTLKLYYLSIKGGILYLYFGCGFDAGFCLSPIQSSLLFLSSLASFLFSVSFSFFCSSLTLSRALYFEYMLINTKHFHYMGVIATNDAARKRWIGF